MPGPPPKPRDQRKRRNADEGTTSTSVTLPAHGDRGMTLADDERYADLVSTKGNGWLKQTRELWDLLWETPAATLLQPQHLPALRRLYDLYDQEERLRREVKKSRLVPRSQMIGMDGPIEEGELVAETHVRATRLPGHLAIGSTGQIVTSPSFTSLMKVRAEIRALEDRLGGTPMASFRMGWQHGEMVQSQAKAAEAASLAAAAQTIAEQHRQALDGAS